MKKWTVEQVEAARVNPRMLMDCELWLRDMFDACPDNVRLWWASSSNTWKTDDKGTFNFAVYRIPENWPPADQIEDAKPTPAEFSTQYMLGGEPYHPEDDETELQRLIDGRDEMNDGIKVIRARLRRFDRFVAKQEGVKG